VTRRTLFWIFVALQALVPVAVAGLREAEVTFGERVLLRATPVDPRDPFRGQYVALRYEISSLDPAGAPEGARVYVRLFRDGGEWRGAYAGTEEPEEGPFVRGRVRDGRIEYGIEQYYADEDEARRLEAALARHRVYADVALGPGGRATLRRLVVR